MNKNSQIISKMGELLELIKERSQDEAIETLDRWIKNLKKPKKK